ncbi:MAG: hydratase [Prevotella sp.]|jgi:aconitate hydratase|uniref:hydratase n=1 Tax=Prevotella sp. Rep29 TaxID=2691580 RepID=UPI001C6E6B9B|nr:hydratase [Prevotella sp. Rep29]MBR1656271.1 hydratase [Prevotella sp.]MBR7093824.1 hydratase [Prevotella sp.]QYR10528.1 hydratase [Prevotella sp. Rep29]
MVELIKQGVYLLNGSEIATNAANVPSPDDARENTITYQILRAHDVEGGKGKKMRIKFDAMMSHDITYVGIIQTARASGLKKFPIPYAMTNCHNSLCAVGGTINEDDHVFGLSAAKKYGGIYVPANQAVIHQYAREAMVKCGNMILGSDSHTRYGSLGNMGVGEGGGELVKQLLENTWDINAPEVVLVWLEGAPRKGVGPHDVAISLVKAVFDNGFVKNKVLEFAGPGVKNLPIDFRNGIDIMTTETTCLSSIWVTDEEVKHHYDIHCRPEDYKELQPGAVAYYDGMIRIDLSKQESMIALPFHPSNAYTIHELQADPERILREVEEDAKKRFGDKISVDLVSKVQNGKVMADQGIIAGCSGGTYDNLSAAAAILNGKSVGNDYFTISAYPQSVPVYMATTRNKIAEELLEAGVVIKPAFCGPCFGAGDVPSNNGLSIRHTTRNFPNREGSKPGQGQISLVALMDARSIAATAANGGIITAATDIDFEDTHKPYDFDAKIYERRVYNGYAKADDSQELKYGPNIKDWPKMYPMEENMLLELAAVIHDPVTTTDELIPSGETSSYRSNPLKLSEFALSRRVPEYVGISKRIQSEDLERRAGNVPQNVCDALAKVGADAKNTSFGSCVFANRPGDGSAREQAASCQKVLGGDANICYEYATKRYRSNCINWGIVPFTIAQETPFDYTAGDFVFIPGIREAILGGKEEIDAKVITANGVKDIHLFFQNLTADERQILADGCLMNYYAAQRK